MYIAYKNIFSFYEKKDICTEIIPPFVIEAILKLYRGFLSLFLWLVPVVLVTWEAEAEESLEAQSLHQPGKHGKTSS